MGEVFLIFIVIGVILWWIVVKNTTRRVRYGPVIPDDIGAELAKTLPLYEVHPTDSTLLIKEGLPKIGHMEGWNVWNKYYIEGIGVVQGNTHLHHVIQSAFKVLVERKVFNHVNTMLDKPETNDVTS